MLCHLKLGFGHLSHSAVFLFLFLFVRVRVYFADRVKAMDGHIQHLATESNHKAVGKLKCRIEIALHMHLSIHPLLELY